MTPVYATLPPVPATRTHEEAGLGLEGVRQAAAWAENSGCVGALIYDDNSLVDPWSLAQVVVERTRRLVPLVAVNPLYAHPFTTARAVASLSRLYDRRIDLNLVAGGFAGYHRQLGDDLDHDQRYERLEEFTLSVKNLLESSRPTTVSGRYYSLDAVRLPIRPDASLLPRLFVAGSSPACIRLQGRLSATRLTYPTSAGTGKADEDLGFRVGIIARADRELAWVAAKNKFPVDREGEVMHEHAAATLESHWHRALSSRSDTDGDVYWSYPFQSYQTFCPYLVGSYDDVSTHLSRWRLTGSRPLVLDVVADESELEDAMSVIRRARLA